MSTFVKRRGWAWLLTVAAGALLLSGCGPVDQKTLDLLPPDQARQLKVWSTNHSIVFDLRIHTMETCPFLVYLPAAMSLHGKEWAEFCWKFYGAKHREEDHCNCDEELAGLDETAPAPKPDTATSP